MRALIDQPFFSLYKLLVYVIYRIDEILRARSPPFQILWIRPWVGLAVCPAVCHVMPHNFQPSNRRRKM